MRYLIDTVRAFVNDDNGAQVIEYALVLALIAVTVALALGNAMTGIPASFVALASRVTDCLTPGSGTC